MKTSTRTPEEVFRDVAQIGDQFAIDGICVEGHEIQSGHINITYLATYEKVDGERRRYILQRVNECVFKDPVAVMRNVERVTRHINDKVLDIK